MKLAQRPNKINTTQINSKSNYSGEFSWRRGIQLKSYINYELLVFIIYLFFTMKAFLNSDSTLSQIQNRLNKYPFLSKSHLPGYPDAYIFLALTRMHKYPDLNQHPYFYHWFILIKQFSITTVNSWLTNQVPAQEDHLIHYLLSLEAQKHLSANPASISQATESTDATYSKAVRQTAETEFLLDVWEGENRPGRWEMMKRQLRPLGVRVEREIAKRETRLTFKGDSRMCEDVLRIVEKCLEYRSIEVKKQRKSKLKR